MSVDIEQLTQRDTFTNQWRITARPDSGKAFWQVEVSESATAIDPYWEVRRATGRAIKIDREFSLEKIEKRATKKRQRQSSARLLEAALHGNSPGAPRLNPNSREEGVA